MLRTRRFQSALRTFRKERDLSQTGLGQLLHRSRQTVANWENGHFTPSDEALQALQAVGFDSSPFMAPQISGPTIRRWRLRNNISQAQLADAIDVVHSCVSHWELNHKRPRAHIRQHLFLLGCPDDHGNLHHDHTTRTTSSGPCSKCPDYSPCKELVDHGLWALCYQEPPTAGELLQADRLLALGAFADNPDLTHHIIETLATHAIEDAIAEIPDPPRIDLRGPMEETPLWF